LILRFCLAVSSFLSLAAKMGAAVKAAAADMSPAMAAAVHSELPQAELVHDKFHVSKLLGEAVDKVRRAEAKKLAVLGSTARASCWKNMR